MRYSVEESVAPAAEPVTRAEAKLHLREDNTEQDDLIDALIEAARDWTENYCRRSWVRRTLVLRLDAFAAEIRLPRGPVSSVTSVQYTDANGATQTAASSLYHVDTNSTPPRIVLATGATWPTPKLGLPASVQITYVAGYAPDSASPTDHAANVPNGVKAAIKLLVAFWYENREAAGEVPMAVKALLARYEIRDLTLES